VQKNFTIKDGEPQRTTPTVQRALRSSKSNNQAMSKKNYLESASEGMTGLKAPENKIVGYRHMVIRNDNGEMWEGHPVYRIYAKDKQQIGLISWYRPWKEYVFSSIPECVFNNSCLRDVLDFIENHTEK
jgi:hypothetical protein